MRSIKSVCLYLFLLFITFGFSLTPLSAQVEECDKLNRALIKYGVPKFNYNENWKAVYLFIIVSVSLFSYFFVSNFSGAFKFKNIKVR